MSNVKSAYTLGTLYLIDNYPGMVLGTEKVYGEILTVNSRIIPIIDTYEEINTIDINKSEYIKKQVLCVLEDGTALQCMTYIYNQPVIGLFKLKSGIFI